MRSVLSRVFRYGIATARCDRDVAADLRGVLATPKTVHHAAITDPGEVGVLLKTMEDYTGQEVTRMALRLSPHLFVRPGELRQAEWSEIDIDKAVWSMPVVSRDLDCQWKTAFVLSHKLREAMGRRVDRRFRINQTGKRQCVVITRERGGGVAALCLPHRTGTWLLAVRHLSTAPRRVDKLPHLV